MNKLLFSVLFLSLINLNLSAQNLTPRTEKKIEKTIQKVWKNQTVEKELISTDSNLEEKIFFSDNYVYRLKINELTQGWMCLRRAYGCKIGGCGTGNYGSGEVCSADGNAYEVFDYAVFFDKDLKIKKVVVTDYPGDYGYEISSPGWLNQFIGFNGGELNYGSDIDAVSGATISANSITWDIVEVHKMMSKLTENDRLISMKN